LHRQQWLCFCDLSLSANSTSEYGTKVFSLFSKDKTLYSKGFNGFVSYPSPNHMGEDYVGIQEMTPNDFAAFISGAPIFFTWSTLLQRGALRAVPPWGRAMVSCGF
jgi:hypothetical protein